MSSLEEPREPIKICLMSDGSVMTEDGEYLGTWQADENDHRSFTPDGHSEPLLFHPFIPILCDMIEAWHEGGALTGIDRPSAP